ncbi:MAG: hypothetical protein LBJ67_12075 [Planctomycetaceae bacterium]|jgi:hypothetical protein|nr:hypothetical protein [Planctomycetaceae bacterium]
MPFVESGEFLAEFYGSFVEGGETLPKENSPLAEDSEPLAKSSESLASVRGSFTLVVGN